MSDTLTLEGATRLAKKINEYWEGRGYHVQARVHSIGYKQQTRAVAYGITSDLVDGAPRNSLHVAPKVAQRRKSTH